MSYTAKTEEEKEAIKSNHSENQEMILGIYIEGNFCGKNGPNFSWCSRKKDHLGDHIYGTLNGLIHEIWK